MQARCRVAFFLLLLPPLFFTSAGCRNKSDLVESELRTKDMLYRDALEEQRRNEARIYALQLENEALRKGSKITPEQAASTYGLKRIVLGRSTGGYDHDGLPGDEQLQVVVEPMDFDDHAIKAPGILQVFTLEIAPQGLKTPLCQWDIPPDEVRKNWKQGLLSTGYVLMLPWKVFPVHEQVRVVVRFITPDQRVFEADRDIKVRVVPGAGQKRPEIMPETFPMPMPIPGPGLEGGPMLLPTQTTSQRPHVTQWRPAPDSAVTIGQPKAIE